MTDMHANKAHHQALSAVLGRKVRHDDLRRPQHASGPKKPQSLATPGRSALVEGSAGSVPWGRLALQGFYWQSCELDGLQGYTGTPPVVQICPCKPSGANFALRSLRVNDPHDVPNSKLLCQHH
jgi:hypothetical protein